MDSADIDDIAVSLLLEALWLRHGYDFRDYARASLKRRLDTLRRNLGAERTVDLIPRLLYEEELLGEVVNQVSVPVSEIFRDPQSFRRVGEEVLPVLASYPHVNIWHAGCANGEEVYSLAILLEEAGIYDRCQIYATDLSDAALHTAETGVYPAEALRDAHTRYAAAGGRRSLSEYFHVRYRYAKADERLKRNILFAQHNLVSDGVFCEAHLVICRNVLIYFNRQLQERVLGLFGSALVRGGFLWLGTKETLDFSALRHQFPPVDREHRLFRYRPEAP